MPQQYVDNEYLTHYWVNWRIKGRPAVTQNICVTSSAPGSETTTDDFPRMIGIRVSLPMEMIQVVSFSKVNERECNG